MDNKMISLTQKIADQLAAELGVLILKKDRVLVLNHLMVNPQFIGHKDELAAELVNRAVALAKKQSLKIWPLGPLARQAFFKRADSAAWLYHKEDK